MTHADGIVEPPAGVVLVGDPRVASIPIAESGEPMIDLGAVDAVRTASPGQDGVARLVRAEVGRALADAAGTLPSGLGLLVVEGYRTPERQRRSFEAYATELARRYPDRDAATIRVLASRFVAPPEGAPPHTTGGAVDITLCDSTGAELDMGSPVDATPEESRGRCFTAAADLSPAQRRNRDLLVATLTEAGFVNYPTEWWHW